MAEWLKPCPFCGNKAVLLRNVEYDRTLWIIECNRCHMEVAAKHRDLINGRKSTHEDLVETWNRRANDDGDDHNAAALMESVHGAN